MIFADNSENRTILAENCEHNMIFEEKQQKYKNITIFADNSENRTILDENCENNMIFEEKQQK
ncbi:hypothetical protein T06_10676 [Trichinella sp. T6]|nr:hypothetical protein T06_10676 [Trichinella sp. T6]